MSSSNATTRAPNSAATSRAKPPRPAPISTMRELGSSSAGSINARTAAGPPGVVIPAPNNSCATSIRVSDQRSMVGRSPDPGFCTNRLTAADAPLRSSCNQPVSRPRQDRSAVPARAGSSSATALLRRLSGIKPHHREFRRHAGNDMLSFCKSIRSTDRAGRDQWIRAIGSNITQKYIPICLAPGSLIGATGLDTDRSQNSPFSLEIF